MSMSNDDHRWTDLPLSRGEIQRERIVQMTVRRWQLDAIAAKGVAGGSRAMFRPQRVSGQVPRGLSPPTHPGPADENREAAAAAPARGQGRRDAATGRDCRRRQGLRRDGACFALESARGPGGQVAFRSLLCRLPQERHALGDCAGTPAPARCDQRDGREFLHEPEKVQINLAAAFGPDQPCDAEARGGMFAGGKRASAFTSPPAIDGLAVFKGFSMRSRRGRFDFLPVPLRCGCKARRPLRPQVGKRPRFHRPFHRRRSSRRPMTHMGHCEDCTMDCGHFGNTFRRSTSIWLRTTSPLSAGSITMPGISPRNWGEQSRSSRSIASARCGRSFSRAARRGRREAAHRRKTAPPNWASACRQLAEEAASFRSWLEERIAAGREFRRPPPVRARGELARLGTVLSAAPAALCRAFPRPWRHDRDDPRRFAEAKAGGVRRLAIVEEIEDIAEAAAIRPPCSCREGGVACHRRWTWRSAVRPRWPRWFPSSFSPPAARGGTCRNPPVPLGNLRTVSSVRRVLASRLQDGPPDYMELVDYEPGVFPPVRCRYFQRGEENGAAYEEAQVCRFSRRGGVALSPDIAIPVSVLFGEESHLARVADFLARKPTGISPGGGIWPGPPGSGNACPTWKTTERSWLASRFGPEVPAAKSRCWPCRRPPWR